MGNELSINGINFKLEDLPSEINLAKLENEGVKKYLSVYDTDKVKGTLLKAELKSAIFDIYNKEKTMSGKKADTNIDEYEAEYIARQYGLEGKNVSDAIDYLKCKICDEQAERVGKKYLENLEQKGIVKKTAKPGVYEYENGKYICGDFVGFVDQNDTIFGYNSYVKSIPFYKDKVIGVESKEVYDPNTNQVVIHQTINIDRQDYPGHFVTKINDDGSCEAENIFNRPFTRTVVLDKNDNIQTLKPEIKQAQENFTPENILPEQVGQKQFNLTKDYSKLGFNAQQNYTMYDGTRFKWNPDKKTFDRVPDYTRP